MTSKLTTLFTSALALLSLQAFLSTSGPTPYRLLLQEVLLNTSHPVESRPSAPMVVEREVLMGQLVLEKPRNSLLLP